MAAHANKAFPTSLHPQKIGSLDLISYYLLAGKLPGGSQTESEMLSATALTCSSLPCSSMQGPTWHSCQWSPDLSYTALAFKAS